MTEKAEEGNNVVIVEGLQYLTANAESVARLTNSQRKVDTWEY